jgi:hypothetical protein
VFQQEIKFLHFISSSTLNFCIEIRIKLNNAIIPLQDRLVMLLQHTLVWLINGKWQDVCANCPIDVLL